jgi:serine protease Do
MSNWTNHLTRPLTWMGIGAAIVGGAVWAQNRGNAPVSGGQPILSFTPARTATAGAAGLPSGSLEDAFVQLAETASKAVVHITTDTSGLNGGTSDRGARGGGEGSGFVYRSDGWIVTNEHVVQGRDQVRVVLADGRELLGKVTPANDPQLDLAVVKVDVKDLPALALSPDKLVKPGQYAIAFGAPFGLENSVTVGHVSAVSRRGQINDPMSGVSRGYTGMIQTDASINPGNSGGPLLNIRGEVIGVNTSIYSTTGGNNGIGFAIPARVVREVANELISKGSFDRGLLGVEPRDLKPFELSQRKLSGGALLEGVPEESGAFKGGIREGDVVVKINEFDVVDELDLRIAAYRHSPGETVRVTYVRDGQVKIASVKLGKPSDLAQPQQDPRMRIPAPELPDFFNQPFGEGRPQTPDRAPRTGKPRLGVSVQAVDATLRKQFSLPEGANGVVVVTVEPGSFAEKLGVKPGDLVVEIDGKRINAVADVAEAMSGVEWGDQVSLGFERYSAQGKSSFRTIVPFQ